MTLNWKRLGVFFMSMDGRYAAGAWMRKSGDVHGGRMPRAHGRAGAANFDSITDKPAFDT
jgi:hypothetical protein